MGWLGFDFGKVIWHLQTIGVTRLIWDGDELTWEPPEAPVHVDVKHSLERRQVLPFTLPLTYPEAPCDACNGRGKVYPFSGPPRKAPECQNCGGRGKVQR